MPITVQRIEPLIYLGVYRDTVTLDDVYGSLEDLRRLLEEDQALFHITILEGQHLKKIPFDLRGLSKAISRDRIATLIVNAPHMAELLGRMVAKFSGHRIEFFDSMEEAITHAQHLIALKKEVS